MKLIDDYYPELVRFLLKTDGSTGPLVLNIQPLSPYKDEDPDDCPPDVRVMFPTDSRFEDMELTDWAMLGMQGAAGYRPTAEATMLTDRLEDEKGICLVLPVLDTLAALSDRKTKDVCGPYLWKPLEVLLRSMPDHAKLLMPVPIRFLQMPGLAAKRVELFSKHQTLIIEHQHPYCGIRFRMNAVHDNHRMATLVLSKNQGKTIFCRIREPELKPLKAGLPLLLNGSQKAVNCGFVCEEELQIKKLTLFHEYEPNRVKNAPEGRPLGEIAEITKGPQLKDSEDGPMGCLTSECITGDLIPDYGKMRRVTGGSKAIKVRNGDLVMDAQTDGNGNLRFMHLESSVDGKTVIDDSLIHIRFREGIDEDVRKLVRTILLSPAAAKLLFPQGVEPLHDFDPEWLKGVRLPIEEDLIREYLRVHEMRDEFSQFADRAEQLLQGVLWEDSVESIRNRIQRGDRELRLIHAAAKSIENIHHQIARYYPRPLSLVWAEYRKSATQDEQARYQRMAKARKAGETLVAFLTLIAASYAFTIGADVMKGYRLSREKNGKKGFDYGTWATTLVAACNKIRELIKSDPSVPDLVSLIDDPAWNSALTGVIDIRNADSHLRISEPELASIADDADDCLNLMFNKVSFLTNWSLRVVDDARYDPHRKLSKVWFRELHGSGLYSETQRCVVGRNDLGQGLLYLVNRIGQPKWHLVDPFIKFLECPRHCFESTFHLDSLSCKPKKPKHVVLKSFEFNSTRETDEFNDQFVVCGMLGYLENNKSI